MAEIDVNPVFTLVLLLVVNLGVFTHLKFLTVTILYFYFVVKAAAFDSMNVTLYSYVATHFVV